MADLRQVDYLVQALTRNQLSADEFQRCFTRLSHEERMLVLERADKAVYGPQAIVLSNPLSSGAQTQAYR
ncbi:MAG: hypothetical protein IANPNBLG_00954 [Bryobacteraceae bacterium]|nr:hypothetical protein [Bryobacteraceae bacterium]